MFLQLLPLQHLFNPLGEDIVLYRYLVADVVRRQPYPQLPVAQRPLRMVIDFVGNAADPAHLLVHEGQTPILEGAGVRQLGAGRIEGEKREALGQGLVGGSSERFGLALLDLQKGGELIHSPMDPIKISRNNFAPLSDQKSEARKRVWAWIWNA